MLVEVAAATAFTALQTGALYVFKLVLRSAVQEQLREELEVLREEIRELKGLCFQLAGLTPPQGYRPKELRRKDRA